MASPIKSVELFVFERPRETAYLGDLRPGDVRLGSNYVVLGFNGTVYPLSDKSVLVRVRDADGVEGWGETYGLVAPRATVEIIKDLFAPYLLASAPQAPDAVWDKLYGLMRVRGYWGGYYADALAAVDIALWDLFGRQQSKSLQGLLGANGTMQLPAYVSGLPTPTRPQRLELAHEWSGRGFHSVKLPISATDNGDVAGEVANLRAGLGPDHRIAVDMHWAYTADQAIELARELEPHRMWFLEAPVEPENVTAQAEVAAGISMPLALGEEWRTLWDYLPRRAAGACSIVQPEMGHTGVTQFMRLGWAASEAGAAIIPHATIGLGIFMAASLRAASSIGAEAHEFQPTIYHRNGELLTGSSACESGSFTVEDTPGHGVVPNADAFRFVTEIN
jgi:L-alanine-DL-glutamate epimerase-like enolase superfamily enzyme